MTDEQLITNLGLTTATDGDNLISETGWKSWDKEAGKDVQGFIKKRLAESITKLKTKDLGSGKYQIVGVTSVGEEISDEEATISLVKPEYLVQSVEITQINLNGVLNSNGQSINNSSALQAEVKFNWDLWSTQGGTSTPHDRSLIDYTLYLHKYSQSESYTNITSGMVEDDWAISGTANWQESGKTVTMPTSAFDEKSGSYLFILRISKINENGQPSEQFAASYYFNLVKVDFDFSGNVRQDNLLLSVLVKNEQILSSDFRVEYKVNSNSLSTPIYFNNNSSVNLLIDSNPPSDTKIYNIAARIVNIGNTIYSDWKTFDILYQPETATTASVLITDVAQKIYNCSAAPIFTILPTKQIAGTTKILIYKYNAVQPTFNYTTQTPYKEIEVVTTSASQGEPEVHYLYNELLSSDNETYLYFVIIPENKEQITQYQLYNINGSNCTRSSYIKMEIVPPEEGTSDYLHKDGAIVDFSQINFESTFADKNSKQIKLFSEDTIDSASGLSVSTNLKRESNTSMYTGFQIPVLPKGINVFKGDGINLYSSKTSGGTSLASGNEFSIEMLIKTYNVSQDDENAIIGKIGNIYLYPSSLRIYEDNRGYETVNGVLKRNLASTYMASESSFSKDELTHIVITFKKGYYPTTYKESVYEDLYGSGADYIAGYESGAKSAAYDCMKIYINGTINRSFTVKITGDNSGQINYRNFALQLMPEFCAIDIYGFRTYNKALTYDEVLKNRMSAMCDLAEKRAFRAANDILYKESDYKESISASDRSNLAKMYGTVSLRKCLALKDDKYKSTYKYPSTPKNVMIIVTDETGALHYGNNSKTGKRNATMFIKYAKDGHRGSGKFIGQYLVGEDGYDSYYKAQGSSAKRYYGAYNVQFSKFIFIPWDNQSDFNTYLGQEKVKNYDFANSKFDWKGESKKEVSEGGFKGLASLKYDLYDLENNLVTAQTSKLVGKVNYASSMQSHKQGACDLYAACYPDKANDYCNRRAVKEDVFYYFYIKLNDCVGENLTFRNVTWENIEPALDKARFFGFQTWGSAKMDKATFGLDDEKDLEYLVVEGADNENQSTNFKAPWSVLQMWKPEDTKKYYYNLISGNKDWKGNNLDQYSFNPNSPDYTTGLMFHDETIMYKIPTSEEITYGKKAVEKAAEAWDIAGNVLGNTDDTGNTALESDMFELLSYPIDSTGTKVALGINSFNRFAEFYNNVYLYDFGNLEIFSDSVVSTSNLNVALKYIAITNEIKFIINNDPKNYYSYPCTAGDMFRYDPINDKWVPGGLSYNKSKSQWETLNVVTLANSLLNYQINQLYLKAKSEFDAYNPVTSQFSRPNSLVTLYGGSNKYLRIDNEVSRDSLVSLETRRIELQKIKGILSEYFKFNIWAHCDVNSFAYHQAAIRFLSGTDNRAKNQYFVIKGDSYAKAEGTDYYERTTVNDKYPNKNKITLFQDDLDTIFATDNNGQQSKDYKLMEPAYNLDTLSTWGDTRSGLWYNFDIVFEQQIKEHLARVIDWALSDKSEATEEGNCTSIISKKSNLYQSFLKIQDQYIPAIGYNHLCEIYYDAPQLLYIGYRTLTDFGKSLIKDPLFNNNKVNRPESLVHGGCFESEKQFLNKRIALLGSYVNSGLSDGETLANTDQSGSAGGQSYTLKFKNYGYIQAFYPIFIDDSHRLNLDLSIQNVTNCDDFLKDYNIYFDASTGTYTGYNPYVSWLTLENTVNDDEISIKLSGGLTAGAKVTNTQYIKEITFTEGITAFDTTYLNNALVIRYDNEIEKSGLSFNDAANSVIEDMSQYVKNVEIMDTPYTKFGKTIVDFGKCTRLKELNLKGSFTGTTRQNTLNQMLLTEGTSLTKVILPSCITNLTLYYYPQLREVISLDQINDSDQEQRNYLTFDGDVNLEQIVIDGRNKFLSDFIEKYVSINTTSIKITNCDKISLSYEALSKLVNVSNVTFSNNVTILVPKLDFSLKLKLYYHSGFGNIDSQTNKVYVPSKTPGITPSVDKDGYEGINLSGWTILPEITLPSNYSSNAYISTILQANSTQSGVSANKIDISKLKFVISGDTFNIIEHDTKGNLQNGVITMTENSSNKLSVVLTIYYNSGVIGTCKINVGYVTAKVGRFANYDGTFSDYYSADAIGFVFAQQGEEDNPETVSIMSLNPLEALPMSWSNTGNTNNLYDVAINDLSLGNSNSLSFVGSLANSEIPQNTITSNTNINNLGVQDETKIALNYMLATAREAIQIYKRLQSYSSYLANLDYTTEWYKETNSSIVTANSHTGNNGMIHSDKDLYQDIRNNLDKSIEYKFDSGTNAGNLKNFGNLGYLAAMCYTPQACKNISNPNKITRKYIDQLWYIPTPAVITSLIKQVISGGSNDRTSTGYVNETFKSNDSSNVFEIIAKNNGGTGSDSDAIKLSGIIKFLGRANKLASGRFTITYDKTPYLENYAYGYDSYYNTGTFSLPYSWYYSDKLTSNNYSNIFPCITINLTTSDYES